MPQPHFQTTTPTPITLKDIDASLREIEELLVAVIDASDDLLGDPSMTLQAASLLDFGLPHLYQKVVALREGIRR